MNKPLDFVAVAEAVLRGEASLETVPGVPGWPLDVPLADSVAVLMHPRFPGCVALIGSVDRVPILCGAASSVLRDFCKEYRAEYFREAVWDCELNEAAIREVLVAVNRMAKGHADFPVLFIPGAEAAELLRELARLWRAGSRDSVH